MLSGTANSVRFAMSKFPESTTSVAETAAEAVPRRPRDLQSASGESLSMRGRMGTVPGFRVLATGSYVPERVVTNADLVPLGCDEEWIIRRTGIRERRHAAANESTCDLAHEAATRCIDASPISVDQIDLIVVATITPDDPTRSIAGELQRRLGCVAPGMDISAACAGFTYALTTASQFIAAGNCRNVLVVGVDVMSRTINPKDKNTYPLFGDGAGAVLLTAEPNDRAGGILAYQMGSEGCGKEMLYIPAGGSRQGLTPDALAKGEQYMIMDGRNVFKWAVRVVDESIKEVLEHAAVAAEQVNLVILHQANQRIIDSAVSDLHLKPEAVFANLDRYGNTSAASIPLALDEAIKAGRVTRGELVLLCGFGAGLVWSTALLRW